MKLFRKITALSLALVVLLSTTGVSVHKHYCMGQLKDVKFYAVAESCAEEMGFSDEVMQKMAEVGCCENTVEEYKVDELTKSTFEVDVTYNPQLLAIMAYVILDLGDLIRVSSKQAFLTYKPPLIEQDIPILTQSFLL